MSPIYDLIKIKHLSRNLVTHDGILIVQIKQFLNFKQKRKHLESVEIEVVGVHELAAAVVAGSMYHSLIQILLTSNVCIVL